jgi:hypothetical protein
MRRVILRPDWHWYGIAHPLHGILRLFRSIAIAGQEQPNVDPEALESPGETGRELSQAPYLSKGHCLSGNKQNLQLFIHPGPRIATPYCPIIAEFTEATITPDRAGAF